VRRIGLVVVIVAFAAAACRAVTPPSASPATTPPPPAPSVSVTQINNVSNPIAMATRQNDPTIYLGTQSGQIYAVSPGDPVTARNLVLDLGSLVKFGGEQGLLGMTFSADGTKLYVHYTSPTGVAPAPATTTVAAYAVSSDQPGGFGAPASGRIVFTYDHSAATNHNGGSLLLGPDGMLYLALGDGGNGNDTGLGHVAGGNAQSLQTLQGKLLRIDPTPSGGMGHTIPSDNPFVGKSDAVGADQGEIWSFGLRNPFRISFDRKTHDLWIADVGQGAREEVDFVAADDATHPDGKGVNFGWNRREGLIAGPDTSPPNTAGGALVDPIFDYDHSHGDCAIIGGYVYRGSAIPGLAGQYLYTDNCNGSIRALTRSGATATNRALGQTVTSPSSFGEDNSGELYVLSLNNGLFKIGPP
jgi:glucose/arabinose dehydrogenase